MAKTAKNKALEALGKKIEKERKRLNIEIADISDQTGLHYNTVANMEDGNDVLLSSFIEVCFALEIHPKNIFNIDLDVAPKYTLSPSRREKSRLTSRIKDLLNKEFFQSWRGARDVVQKLNKDFQLEVDSKNVSSILRRLVREQKLKLKKKGRKNYYKILK